MTDVNELNLTSIKDKVTWDELATLNAETIEDINRQLLLVYELRGSNEKSIVGDTKLSFDGLEASFKDLIREVIDISLKHSKGTLEHVLPDNSTVVVPEKYLSGVVSTDDECMSYVNVASAYINVQEKTANLIATGWVDLFVKLKLPLTELNKTIEDGLKEGEK